MYSWLITAKVFGSLISTAIAAEMMSELLENGTVYSHADLEQNISFQIAVIRSSSTYRLWFSFRYHRSASDAPEDIVIAHLHDDWRQATCRYNEGLLLIMFMPYRIKASFFSFDRFTFTAMCARPYQARWINRNPSCAPLSYLTLGHSDDRAD